MYLYFLYSIYQKRKRNQGSNSFSEKHTGKKAKGLKHMYVAFVDLEKAFDNMEQM